MGEVKNTKKNKKKRPSTSDNPGNIIIIFIYKYN